MVDVDEVLSSDFDGLSVTAGRVRSVGSEDLSVAAGKVRSFVSDGLFGVDERVAWSSDFDRTVALAKGAVETMAELEPLNGKVVFRLENGDAGDVGREVESELSMIAVSFTHSSKSKVEQHDNTYLEVTATEDVG